MYIGNNAGNNDGTININNGDSYTGTVSVASGITSANNTSNTRTVHMYNGILNLSGGISGDTDFNVHKGTVNWNGGASTTGKLTLGEDSNLVTINTQNHTQDTLSFKNLELTSGSTSHWNMEIGVVVETTTWWADNIALTGGTASTGTGSLIIDTIRLVVGEGFDIDNDLPTSSIQIATSNVNGIALSDEIKLYINDSVTPEDVPNTRLMYYANGKLYFNAKRAYSLVDFIADASRSSNTYNIPKIGGASSPDETIEKNLGNLIGDNADVIISGYDAENGIFGTLNVH